MDKTQLESLVRELVALPKETEWVERKHSKADPVEIGEYVSALSNSAALHDKPCAYVLWGVDDKSGQVVGTTFRPRQAKVGNEELENWLLTQLDPRVDVRIHEDELDRKHVVLFEIQPASHKPVGFRGTEWIRIGSYKKKLRDHPEKERELWRRFDRRPYEQGTAREGATSDEVLALLDYPNYFRLIGQPLPENRAAILERLASEKVIAPTSGGKYDMSNVGAILFARNLTDFDRLARKALRVIIYKGSDRVETIKEQAGSKGYAIGFEGAVSYIDDQLPQNEQIGQALRKEVRTYPEIAVRELVANALIHQDFNVTGAGPMVEIFTDRIEISNPGIPLIDTQRFIDEPPQSRNEMLAALMRRVSICEERGSGIDKVIVGVELFQLPAPDFRVAGNSTVAVLYGPRKFAQMNREERVRACYQHACLQYVSGKRMTNASLRNRLGIKDSSYPLASSIIRDAICAGRVKPHGQGTGSSRSASYVPSWA
ncbi:MAG: ATP-binding protein [Planctomycetota bacterium]|nr:ATP-binding protein [Planctomycetota bacterium]